MDAVGGRRRGATKHSAEDQALNQIARELRPVNDQRISLLHL